MNEWLSFLSTLIWQVIVFSVLYFSRSELKTLVGRLASFKHGDTELLFQESSAAENFAPSEEIIKEFKIRDEAGFFTKSGIRDLVANSPEFDQDDEVANAKLVFKTSKQRTWLVSSKKFVYFVLDDENTRSRQRLIQKKHRIDESHPVTTALKSGNTGTFALGNSPRWLYSINLLGNPAAAELELQEFLR